MKQHHTTPIRLGLAALTGLTLIGCGGGGSGGGDDGLANSVAFGQASRSASLALTTDDRRLVVVNRDKDSLTVLGVRNVQGLDVTEKIAEIAVGDEPRAVVISPDNKRAYTANTVSGTVSVVSLLGKTAFTVLKTIPVGTEPRALALSPTGKRLFVANHTQGTVSVIDTVTLTLLSTVTVGGNPSGVTVSNDGDLDDNDEKVFVSQFYSELIPGGPGEVFDNGKQGVVTAFDVPNGPPERVTIAPIANVGFTADRAPFCAAFNPNVHSQIYCPDTNSVNPLDPQIAADPQGAFPNQLMGMVLRNGLLYVPGTAASPEPPVQFRVNVQGLVSVIDAVALAERHDLQVNLNAQIKLETQPANPTQSLDRIFASDLVDMDADHLGSRFLIVSHGGNFVIQAGIDVNGKLTINAPTVKRYQTGNVPNGVVISRDGKRAYTNNEVGYSVTSIDLENEVVLTRDIPSSTTPQPGTFDHGVLAGKLAFFTTLGVPDFGLFSTQIRDIVPLENRSKASDNGWSSCAACHPDGLADGVTWIFGTGPRQTIPLDAFFSKFNPGDQRISNWSAVMGSITDFNNNARGVQGGTGFAGVPPPATIFQHGITTGGSDSLDAMTLWVQTVRAPIMPDPTDIPAFVNGNIVFEANCASCHAGAKWTKSQVTYLNDPTFTADPNLGGVVLDPGLVNAGPQIKSHSKNGLTLNFLENVGTFNLNDPTEIRGQPPTAGNVALGGLGFNVPSLLGAGYHAPYLHNGAAHSFDEVFALHNLGAGTIESTLSAQDRSDLKVFLQAIDGASLTSPSAADDFLDGIGH